MSSMIQERASFLFSSNEYVVFGYNQILREIDWTTAASATATATTTSLF